MGSDMGMSSMVSEDSLSKATQTTRVEQNQQVSNRN